MTQWWENDSIVEKKIKFLSDIFILLQIAFMVIYMAERMIYFLEQK